MYIRKHRNNVRNTLYNVRKHRTGVTNVMI